MDYLKITITLEHGMAEPKTLFHLDALLGALKVQQARSVYGEQINPRDFHYDIPVERYTTSSGDWVFKASAFKIELSHPKEYWFQTKRMNITQIANHRANGFLTVRASKPRIDTQPLKPNFNHSSVVIGSLVAYCVGNKQGIKTLLNSCKKIGGLRGVGFGNVAGIDVSEIDKKDCDWYWRAMPLDSDTSLLLDEHIKCVTGMRAPYWDRTLHALGYLPTQHQFKHYI